MGSSKENISDRASRGTSYMLDLTDHNVVGLGYEKFCVRRYPEPREFLVCDSGKIELK